MPEAAMYFQRRTNSILYRPAKITFDELKIELKLNRIKIPFPTRQMHNIIFAIL